MQGSVELLKASCAQLIFKSSTNWMNTSDYQWLW